MQKFLRFATLAAVLMTAAALPARAQVPAPGSLGVVAFVDRLGALATFDFLNVVFADFVPPGSPVVPPGAQLTFVLAGQLNPNFQSRAQLTGEEGTFLIVNTGVSVIIFVQTVIPGADLLEYVVFPFGGVPSSGFLFLGSGGGPLDLAVDPVTATVWATSLDAAGLVDVFVTSYAGATPTLVSLINTFDAPSRLTTQMTLDATGTVMVVPTFNGINCISTATQAPQPFSPILVPAGDMVATNVANNFAGGSLLDNIVITAPQAPGIGGGTFIAFDAVGGGSLPGALPWGGAVRPTIGFNDVAISRNTPGGPGSTATVLLRAPGSVIAAGGVSQIAHSIGGLITAGPLIGIPQGTPFGDPEASRTLGQGGDPVTFQVSGVLNDSIGAVGTGFSYTANSYANAVMPGGFWNFGQQDRPYSLPGGNDILTTASIGAVGSYFARLAGPAGAPAPVAFISAPALIGVGTGAPSVLPTVLIANTSFPAFAAGISGFAGGSHHVTLGAPLVAPPAPAISLISPLGIATAALPIGVVADPPPLAGPGIGIVAKRAALTYGITGLLHQAFPETNVGGGGQVSIYPGSVGPATPFPLVGFDCSQIVTF